MENSFSKCSMERIQEYVISIIGRLHKNDPSVTNGPETGNVYEVYDLRRLPPFWNVQDAVDHLDMTALSDYVWGGLDGNESNSQLEEDTVLQRLSLAYENLHSIPKVLVDELADNIRILDISNNNIDDLSFLSRMKKLTSLICDRNDISARTELPYTPTLELLWMNNCHIDVLFPWCRKLKIAFPNLRYLSLMGNPAVPSYLRGGDRKEYTQYRLFMISLFPRLIHLDEKRITNDERLEAEKMYHRPIFDKLMPVSNSYLRRTTERLSEMFLSTPAGFKDHNVRTNSIV